MRGVLFILCGRVLVAGWTGRNWVQTAKGKGIGDWWTGMEKDVRLSFAEMIGA